MLTPEEIEARFALMTLELAAFLPALVEACRREVERRRLTAAHGPQPAAAGAVA